MLILVLEASTTSAKAMLYSAQKGVLAVKSLPYDASFSDVKTQDADKVFEAVAALGKSLAKGKEISAVAVCGTWHNILICDKNLNLKSRAYSWAYTDAAEKAEEIRKDPVLTYDLYHRTGCMPNVTYPSYRLMYLREHGIVPDKDDLLFGQGTYIFARLTGEILESQSMASASGLLNIHTLTWDEKVMELLGITSHQLPPLIDHTQIRPLSQKGAQALGIKAGTPVVPAHPDGALNQVGAGALRPSIMTLSIGTSGAMRLTVENPVLPKNSGTWCYYAPGKWLAGAAVANCTNCVDWFMQKLLCGQFTFSQMERYMQEDTAPTPVFLPFLFGERCPGWNDTRMGSFLGINGFQGIGAIYRGLLEGISFSLLHCYRILSQLCNTPNEIRLSGGILKSPIWTQMLCDIFSHEMIAQETEQASMLGAACLGLLAAGAISDFSQFSPGTSYTISPRKETFSSYEEKYQAYLKKYETVL